MRKTLIILSVLCLAVLAGAQPWGPVQIAITSDSTQNLHSPQIAIVDSHTARVFYTLDVSGNSEIRTALYDLVNHQIIGSIETASTDTTSRTLLDAAADGMDNWVVVYERRSSAYWSYTSYLIGSGSDRSERTFATTGEPSVPWLASYFLSDFDLVPRVGGGWLLTWVQITRSPLPFSEDASEIFVAGLSGDSMEYQLQLLPEPNLLFGPYHAAAVSATPDCSLVITEYIWGDWPEVPTNLLRAVNGAENTTLDTVCTFECSVHPHGFRRALDGSLLVYTDPNSLFRINETRGCEGLGSLSPSGAPADLAFQAGYGFASIWTNPSWIKLGRMHEDGTMIEPGVFYWRDSVHTVRSASVAIASDGKIYVAWTEGSSSETRLMIGCINWDTPLGANDPSSILHPSSFVLSAFPNPFNSALKIEYALPNAQNVNLCVFNVLGQKVETLVASRRESGSHAIAWNPTGAGGVYFVTLQTETTTKSQKVLYVR